MIVRLCVAATIALTAAVPASAQSMNAEAFHKRANALQKKGPLALLEQGEIKALMTEVQAAGTKAREHRLAAVRAGKKPRYCPPEGEKTDLNSNEFMQRLSAIPATQRALIDMTEATTRVLAGKFPCRA